MIFFMIFLLIHKVSCCKVTISTGVVETRWLGGNFLMVHRNHAGRLGSDFISVCLETSWLGQKNGFYAPERPRIPTEFKATLFFGGGARCPRHLPGVRRVCCSVFSVVAATHYNTLQHTATHCNTLQCTAMHFNTPHHKNTIKD